MHRKSIACIGLGIMGGSMASHFLKAGFQVRGVDPNPAATKHFRKLGVKIFEHPAEAASGVDAALIMVSQLSQVEEVLFGRHGMATAMPRGSVIWLASTVPPSAVVNLGTRLSDLGLFVVDGPVSGGRTQAEAGCLTVIAGASAAAMERARPFMAVCAERVFHVGHLGAGSKIKIINNLLAASHVALTAEAVAFASRAGIEAECLLEVVKHSSGASRMFEKRAERMFSGDHTVHASIGTFLKDLDIALEEAFSYELAVPMASSARRIFQEAADNGLAQESDTRLLDYCLTKVL